VLRRGMKGLLVNRRLSTPAVSQESVVSLLQVNRCFSCQHGISFERLLPHLAGIHQPVLAILGTASLSMFAERHKLLLHWLPNAEPLDLPGLTHLLHARDPAAVAAALASFFARHPIPEPL
jgi:pimeloyl-ACP methyl ester carboxylesterase